MKAINQHDYETGAKTHAVNDLILFTESTGKLYDLKKRAVKGYTDTAVLLRTAIDLYYREFKQKYVLTPEQKEDYLNYYNSYLETFGIDSL